MSKKGVSDVITTVLMILIVLAAIGIVWAVVSSFLNNSTEQIDLGAGFSQIDIVDNSIKYLPSDVLQIRVKRDSNPGNISGLRIIVESVEGNVQSYDINTPVKELETKTIDVQLQGKIQNISKVSIAPRTPIKNKVKTGQTADEQSLGKGVVSDQGLVLYLPFDGDMRDKSGNDNDGSCTGSSCPVSSTGKFGSSYSYDGVDDYVQVNYNSFPGLDGTKETLLIWVKPRGSSILLQNAAWSRRLYYDNSNKFSFYFYDSSPTPILTSVLDDALYSRDQWHQLGYTFSSNTVKMYVDGKQTKTVILANSLYNPNSYWHFGHLCAGASCNYYYTGELDEVRIYNRTLSDQEIYYLYKYN